MWGSRALHGIPLKVLLAPGSSGNATRAYAAHAKRSELVVSGDSTGADASATQQQKHASARVRFKKTDKRVYATRTVRCGIPVAVWRYTIWRSHQIVVTGTGLGRRARAHTHTHTRGHTQIVNICAETHANTCDISLEHAHAQMRNLCNIVGRACAVN